MSIKSSPITILMADDNDTDRKLTMEALQHARLVNELHFVEDGQELMDYLRHTGKYTVLEPARPGLILLDLQMPKKDGHTALAEIKSDPALCQIPVVILTGF